MAMPYSAQPNGLLTQVAGLGLAARLARASQARFAAPLCLPQPQPDTASDLLAFRDAVTRFDGVKALAQVRVEGKAVKRASHWASLYNIL
jgi:hypothetical protein